MKEIILFIGGGSNASRELAQHISSETSANFFGLTSQKKTMNGPLQLFSYLESDRILHFEFDTVFILASRLPHECDDINDFRKVNEVIEKLLERIKFRDPKTSKIIFLSTFSLYPKNKTFIDENTDLNFDSPYNLSKYEMEIKVREFTKNYSIPSIIARLPVFLYRNGKSNFINRLASKIKQNATTTLFNRELAFGSVYDVKSLSAFAKLELVQKHTYLVNCCSVADITFNELAILSRDFGLKEVLWQESNEISPKISFDGLRKLGAPIPSAKNILIHYFQEELSTG